MFITDSQCHLMRRRCRVVTLCSEKNTHSHFLSYLHELFVDLNKNCSKYTQGLTDSGNVKIRYSNGMQIPVVEQAKFLGLIFDRKLTFVPHLRYLRQKCMKALNLLRVIAHAKWSSDEATLLHLYRPLIRSTLDYGTIVYGSARKSYLRMLDLIQNQALRLCLGAFRTSPATSMHVEANEMPCNLI